MHGCRKEIDGIVGITLRLLFDYYRKKSQKPCPARLLRLFFKMPKICAIPTKPLRRRAFRLDGLITPTLKAAGSNPVGRTTHLQKPMAFGGCPLPQLTNTAVPWYNKTPKSVWIFLEQRIHFSPRTFIGARRFLLVLGGTTDEHILPTHRVRRTDRHGSQLLAE